MKTIWKAMVKKDDKLSVITSKCICTKSEFKKELEGLGYQTNSKMIKPTYEFDYVLEYTSAKQVDFECGITHIINPGLLGLIKKYNQLHKDLYNTFCAITGLLRNDDYPLDDPILNSSVFNFDKSLPDLDIDCLVSWYAEQYHSEK